MKRGEARITVDLLQEGERGLWREFLAKSPTGSLYHDLDFLAYHPEGRFGFEHLVLRQEGRILALVPGGPRETGDGTVYISPLGASFGGPALAQGMPVSRLLAMIQALQEYVLARGFAGVDMTLAPPVFAPRDADALTFALFARGFRLANRWLCSMLDLKRADAPRYEKCFNKTKATLVRGAKRKGMELVETGVEGLPHFLEVFNDTYRRHGAAPTHSPEEIAWLLEHLPDRVRLFLAMLDGRCAAGVLTMALSPEAVYTFYICISEALSRENGAPFLFAGLADLLAGRGVRWLDLGPSCRDGNFNAGVTFFKDSLGCEGHCRDRWSWRAAWTDVPPLAKENFMSEETS